MTVPPSARLAGLPLPERVLRPARRAGYDRIIVWLPVDADGTSATGLHRLMRNIGGEIVIARTADQWAAALARLAPADAVTAIGAGTSCRPRCSAMHVRSRWQATLPVTCPQAPSGA